MNIHTIHRNLNDKEKKGKKEAARNAALIIFLSAPPPASRELIPAPGARPEEPHLAIYHLFTIPGAMICPERINAPDLGHVLLVHKIRQRIRHHWMIAGRIQTSWHQEQGQQNKQSFHILQCLPIIFDALQDL